jgi:prepilin-type N-terminal cleavage/methylation domain-containing protein
MQMNGSSRSLRTSRSAIRNPQSAILSPHRNVAAGRKPNYGVGFTLIEVCVAIIIVGVAITALMTGIASGTRINDAGQNLTEAIFLTQEVREYTLTQEEVLASSNPPQSFASIWNSFVGAYSPPVDGQGHTISGLSGWSQAISIAYMDPATMAVVPGPTDLIRVTVTISRNNVQIMSTSWLVAKKTSEQ